MRLDEQTRKTLKRFKTNKSVPQVIPLKQKRLMEVFGIPIPPLFPELSKRFKKNPLVK